MALPMLMDRGRHCTRNWMALFSCCVRSLDSTLPANVKAPRTQRTWDWHSVTHARKDRHKELSGEGYITMTEHPTPSWINSSARQFVAWHTRMLRSPAMALAQQHEIPYIYICVAYVRIVYEQSTSQDTHTTVTQPTSPA